MMEQANPLLSSLGMRRSATLIVALSLLTLTACGGGGGGKCSEEIWTGEFGICLNAGWEQVSDEQLREEGVPIETLAAFQLKERRAGQRDNIVVSYERIGSKASSLKYSEVNIQTIEATPEYKLIEKREIEVDGEDSLLHVFTARPVPDLPARHFYQVSATKGTTGYVFTGTLPFAVEAEIEEGLIDMLLSGSLKKK
jgi:hypothetical protein